MPFSIRGFLSKETIEKLDGIRKSEICKQPEPEHHKVPCHVERKITAWYEKEMEKCSTKTG